MVQGLVTPDHLYDARASAWALYVPAFFSPAPSNLASMWAAVKFDDGLPYATFRTIQRGLSAPASVWTSSVAL